MIKKLLLTLIVFVTFNSYAQSVAYPVPNIHLCNYEVFDLTTQEGIVLQNQNPAQFSVNYFLSAADADSNMNPIADPAFFVGSMVNIIYIRVTNLQDNSFDVTSFTASWSSVMPIGPFADVTVCDMYTLPQLPANQNYFTGPEGTGTMIAPGTVVTMTQQIFVSFSDGSCNSSDDFMVVIVDSPMPPSVADISVCDSYVLPPTNGTYNTAPNGTGAPLFAGDVITATTTVYLTVSNGACSSEDSFMVTVFPSPTPPQVSDVTACESYVLPSLPPGQNYFSESGGFGIQYPAGHMFTETATLYVFAESGTTPNCTTEMEFSIYIGNQSYDFAPIVQCPDSNGLTTFDLNAIAQQMQSTIPMTVISFHLTESDAIADVGAQTINSIQGPGSDLMYVRVEALQICFSVSPITLISAECTNNTITGTITLDDEADGCDSTDTQMSNVQVMLTNGNTTSFAYSNVSGSFEFTNVEQGNNILTVQNLPAGYTISPSPNVVAFSDVNQISTANFCVTSPTAVHDANIFLMSTGQPIPGFQMHYIMKVRNFGSSILSGNATFTYDNEILSFSSTSPTSSSQTTNTITFNYTNLHPNGQLTYHLYFTVFTPPTVVSGDMLAVSAVVNTAVTDINLANNLVTMQQIVVNSYDPNDISVHEGPFISEQQADGYLHYTIRFQNMGTSPAHNVRLENQLDPNLDWSTFMPLAASHTYLAERNGGALIFRFNNIMLPAEQDNEPASHGWVTYKIKPVLGFAIGDVISNIADIYFDFNEAIVTNTVTTQIQQLSLTNNDFAALRMYPNPTSGKVYFKGIEGQMQIEVYDVQGKLIKSDRIDSNQSLDVSHVETGIYFIKISSDGMMVTRKLMVE